MTKIVAIGNNTEEKWERSDVSTSFHHASIFSQPYSNVASFFELLEDNIPICA